MKQNPHLRLANPNAHPRSAIYGFAFVVCFLLLPALVSAADQKLILKDGSDHIVRSYEIRGDRVRYFSTERKDWEELPSDLVDWAATEEANKPPEIVPEVELEVPPQFLVAPGLPLPEAEGIYAFDGVKLIRLSPSQAQIHNDRSRTLLGLVVPGVKGKAYAELSGATAGTERTEGTDEFFLQFSQPSPGGYGLVRLESKSGRRIVGEIEIASVSGKMTESQNRLSTTIDVVRPGSDSGDLPVLRLSPKSPLKPGQYAIVEFIQDGQVNLFVWDFAVTASTPVKSLPKP